MNLRARTTWTNIAHFPKIIFLRSFYDSIFRNNAFPNVVSLGILGGWLPEARASLRDTATFVRRVLDVAGDLTAETLPPDAG